MRERIMRERIMRERIMRERIMRERIMRERTHDFACFSGRAGYSPRLVLARGKVFIFNFFGDPRDWESPGFPLNPPI